jgi:UDP-N-acetylglucosamine--N-acetylmuramyl-(pentapeptide) pyrophosphoryl-undecaprenol N-acetylglucosamine transferase
VRPIEDGEHDRGAVHARRARTGVGGAADGGEGAGGRVPKVVIAAGGTAGHVVPALAIAAALRERGVEVEFVGGERAEAELVPAAGYPFHRLRLAGLDRRNPLKALRAALLAAYATFAARRLLRRIDANAVLGGGGYVAGPVGLAGRSLRLPLVLTEADSHLGVANRVLARLARRVFLAFPLPGREGGRYVVSGRALPAATGQVDRAAARRRFGLEGDALCLLIFGGSLGAKRLNHAALDAFGSAAPCFVLHASGRRDYEELRRRLDELGSPRHYRLEPYIEPFADALAAADLVVARAGGSVLELAAVGLPSLLVPYPYATADHQTANARYMEAAGAAVVVPDEQLDGPRLAREVGSLLAAPQRMSEMSNAALAAARPDAAERIADEIVALL